MQDFKELEDLFKSIPGFENVKFPKIPDFNNTLSEWARIPILLVNDSEEKYEVLHIDSPQLIDEVISVDSDITQFTYKDCVYITNLSVAELSKLKFKN